MRFHLLSAAGFTWQHLQTIAWPSLQAHIVRLPCYSAPFQAKPLWLPAPAIGSIQLLQPRQ